MLICWRLKKKAKMERDMYSLPSLNEQFFFWQLNLLYNTVHVLIQGLSPWHFGLQRWQMSAYAIVFEARISAFAHYPLTKVSGEQKHATQLYSACQISFLTRQFSQWKQRITMYTLLEHYTNVYTRTRKNYLLRHPFVMTMRLHFNPPIVMRGCYKTCERGCGSIFGSKARALFRLM